MDKEFGSVPGGWRRIVLMMMVMLLASMVIAACNDDSNGDVLTPTEAMTGEPAQDEIDDGEQQGEDSEMNANAPMQWSSPPEMQLQDGADYRATLKTNKGDVVVDLLQSEAPETVNNFVFLAEQGFYNEVPFHRVIENFMIQSGDPTGTGAGGPGYQFDDEPVTRDYERGTLAMANAGPNTNGSQFFIVHADMRGRLPKDYTIFGQVVDGLDVVDDIAATPVEANRMGEQSVPTEPLFINSVDIEVQ